MDEHLLGKILSASAGFFGGLSVSFFYQPKKLHARGKFLAGVIVGGISVSTTVALAGMGAKLLGLSLTDPDVALCLGYLIGLVSVGFVAWVANFLERTEDSDIVEIASEVKEFTSGVNSKHPKRKNNANTDV